MEVQKPTEAKFSDEEYIKYHNFGYSDRRIAKIFGVSTSTVVKRRWKLKLSANFESFGKESLSEKEQIQRRKDMHLVSRKKFENKCKNSKPHYERRRQTIRKSQLKKRRNNGIQSI